MSCFCITQTLIWIYFFWYVLNNFITRLYLVSCSLQGVWVFEHLGNREELITDIMADIDRCEGWRSDMVNRWVRADYNSTHSVCTVDFTSRDSALTTLQDKCHLGSSSSNTSSWW